MRRDFVKRDGLLAGSVVRDRDHYCRSVHLDAPKFCQVLQAKIVPNSAAEEFWPDTDRPWSAFPWVTPILGSGALGLTRAFAVEARFYPDVIASRALAASLGKNRPARH